MMPNCKFRGAESWAERWAEVPYEPSGIYALYWKGKCVYIGKSECVHNRLMSHRNRLLRWRKGFAPKVGDNPVIQFDRVFVMWVPMHELDRAEFAMINKYQPEYNIALKRDFVPLDFNLEEVLWKSQSKTSSKASPRR